MPATKAPAVPTQRPPADESVLENFYTVAEAAIRLKLRDKDDPSKKGEKFLRDGVNRQGWPCHRMAKQLLFSDSDLAAIAELNRNKPDARSGPRPSTGRPRRRSAAVKTPALATP